MDPFLVFSQIVNPTWEKRCWEVLQALGHVGLYTRPDVLSCVEFLISLRGKYNEEHWQAIEKILLYLRTTQNHELVYGAPKHFGLNRYTDYCFYRDPRMTLSLLG